MQNISKKGCYSTETEYMYISKPKEKTLQNYSLKLGLASIIYYLPRAAFLLLIGCRRQLKRTCDQIQELPDDNNRPKLSLYIDGPSHL